MTYQSRYQQSLSEPEAFWKEQADQLHWFNKPTQILSQNEQGHYRWFADGELNMAYLCLDFHVENGRANQTALIYDSPVTRTVRRYTYAELRSLVAHFAGGLRKKGIGKGDTVVIYMPMIPEAVIAMLACARLGAIHSVVFGGFAPHELAMRIDDAEPKAIISASYGIEIDKVIPYKPLVDKAIEEATHKPPFSIFFQREYEYDVLNGTTELDFMHVLYSSNEIDCVPVQSTDPLYVLYTSGTTGKPKGIVRDTGGYATALNFSMKQVYNIDAGETFWAASDIGWVVGHSFIVYGPLLCGCQTILYEGKPIKTPDAGAFWRVMAEHKVNIMFTAPTALRAIKKEDNEGALLRKYDISKLRTLFLAGERLDPPTYHWIKDLCKNL
jgi:acyl-coenzyme A synthetase/AMP-(fatty) acid ligase